jgi:hypothetical protein
MIVGKPEVSSTASAGALARANRLSRVADVALLAVLMALLAILLVKSIFSAATAAEMFSYPFQFDESEGMIVAETILLDSGVNIYEKPSPQLFVAAPYPPLFYLLDWPVQHLLGQEPSFKIGRGISLLATAFVGLAILAVAFALTRDLLAGAVGALAWPSLALVTFWGSLVKPDMLALALGLAGLWWVVARPPGQVWWALPFFLAAFYTKQTAIAAAVAVTLWLLITRPRIGLAFGSAYAVGALVPSLLFNGATNGGYFYHMFTIHDLPWFPGRFVEYVSNFALTFSWLVVPGVVALLFVGAQWLLVRTGTRPSLLPRDAGFLLALYLGMSVVAAIGTGTHGGNHNHLLDLAAACCLGLSVGVALARHAPPAQIRLAFAIVGLVVITQLPSLFSVPAWLRSEFSPLSSDKREGMVNVFQYVTNNSDDAYSDNVGLMLSAHKRLWTTDPFTQTHATQYGRWDESELVGAIRGRRFSQIVVRIDVFAADAGAGDISPGILQAVRDNYKLDQRNVENIYIPR